MASSESSQIPGAGGEGRQEHEGQTRSLELVDRHGAEDLPGQGRFGVEAIVLPGRKADRSPRSDVAEMRRDGRRGRSGIERGGQHGAREHEAAARQRAAELLPCSGQPAAERAGRASESSRRLVECETLEVTEHDRRAEGIRQAVDLAVQDLGLLAVEHGLIGRRGRRLECGIVRAVAMSSPCFEASPAMRARVLALRAVRRATP